MSAEPASHLRLVRVDDETGEVEHVESRALEQLEHELAKLRTDLKMAKRDVTSKNRQIAELERNKAFERLHHPDREFIERVAGFWHKLCRAGDKRVNPLSPMRFDALAALVEMEVIVRDANGKRVGREPRYKPVDFEIAVRGARFDHYVKQRKNGTEQHFDDLEFICRDSKNFEECIARCPVEVAALARARKARNNGRESSTSSASLSAASPEVRYAQGMGLQGSGQLSRRGETPRPHVRLGVDAGAGAFPASRV
jgi:hypothetical protein